MFNPKHKVSKMIALSIVHHIFHKTDRGVTLIELLVTLILTAVLIMALSTIFISTKRAQIRGTEDATLPSNAQFILDRMAREIRLAKYIEIRDGSNNIVNLGTRIRCQSDIWPPDEINTVDEDTGYIFYPNIDLNESRLVYRPDWNDATNERVISRNVENLEFERVFSSINTIRIRLELKQELKGYEHETDVFTTVNLRCVRGNQ